MPAAVGVVPSHSVGVVPAAVPLASSEWCQAGQTVVIRPARRAHHCAAAVAVWETALAKLDIGLLRPIPEYRNSLIDCCCALCATRCATVSRLQASTRRRYVRSRTWPLMWRGACSRSGACAKAPCARRGGCPGCQSVRASCFGDSILGARSEFSHTTPSGARAHALSHSVPRAPGYE